MTAARKFVVDVEQSKQCAEAGAIESGLIGGGFGEGSISVQVALYRIQHALWAPEAVSSQPGGRHTLLTCGFMDFELIRVARLLTVGHERVSKFSKAAPFIALFTIQSMGH